MELSERIKKARCEAMQYSVNDSTLTFLQEQYMSDKLCVLVNDGKCAELFFGEEI